MGAGQAGAEETRGPKDAPLSEQTGIEYLAAAGDRGGRRQVGSEYSRGR